MLLLLHGAMLLPECDVLGVMDPDVQLMGSAGALEAQPQIARWLASNQKLFISREPPGGWQKGSAKDFHGKNNLRNTDANCGFVLIKSGKNQTREAVAALLRRWWCAAEPASGAVGDLGEPLSIYRQAWPMEGRAFQHTLRHAPEVRLAREANDYNSPHGVFARHHWFKPDHNAAHMALQSMRMQLQAVPKRLGQSPYDLDYGRLSRRNGTVCSAVCTATATAERRAQRSLTCAPKSEKAQAAKRAAAAAKSAEEAAAAAAAAEAVAKARAEEEARAAEEAAKDKSIVGFGRVEGMKPGSRGGTAHHR